MNAVKQNMLSSRFARLTLCLIFLIIVNAPITSQADITGHHGTTFNLKASEGYVSVGDGASIYTWGYSMDTIGSLMQLPGPTLIVNEGETITITLNNSLPAAAGNVSIVFPGHTVEATNGVTGSITREAPVGGSVTYTFVATNPGTYQYHSGTQTDIQVEMGLYGALIVRPNNTLCAYNHQDTCFDREHLFMLSEMDLDIHQAVEQQSKGAGPIEITPGPYFAEYWFINGRAAPDTLAPAGTDLLPTQPYDALALMEPGEKLLLRLIGTGSETHPFHTHGNHVKVLANDGRLIKSSLDNTKLAGPTIYTPLVIPGGTIDAMFEWTGKKLGWDMYGHTEADNITCDDGTIYDTDGVTVLTPGSGYHEGVNDDNYREWCEDHNRPIPVALPALGSLAFGGFYSGSPYLGFSGSLPPGEGGLNPWGGFTYMWHSHTEKELVNNDVFPGGMLTLLVIVPPQSLPDLVN